MIRISYLRIVPCDRDCKTAYVCREEMVKNPPAKQVALGEPLKGDENIFRPKGARLICPQTKVKFSIYCFDSS
jgi:hypothetical protein